MTITIFHNPRCSKSRKTLELIRDAGVVPCVVRYLEEPPDAAAILRFAKMLGVPVSQLLRRGETEYKQATDLPELDDDAALAAWLADNPRVLQRPVVINDERQLAVIGRPPENVHELL